MAIIIITLSVCFMTPLLLASLANCPPVSLVEMMVVVLLSSSCMQLSAQPSLSLLQEAAGLQGEEHSADRLHDSHTEDLQHHGVDHQHRGQHALPVLLPGHLQHVLQAVPGTLQVISTYFLHAVLGHGGQVQVGVEGDDLLPDGGVCTPQP